MPLLHWLTRDQDIQTAAKVPHRILQEVPELSYGEPSQNLLVQGDNLEALKALLPFYAGQVKCIYIDPPYNTGSAFEHYDDALEHSKWLAMMLPRLQLLREFLREDGTIWVSIDDREGHYLKVMMDEVFGRENFINHISVKMKLAAGASGGGEDKKLKKNIEHLFVYAKNNSSPAGFRKFHDYFVETDLMEQIEEMRANDKSWKYTSVALEWGGVVSEAKLKTGSGEDLDTVKYTGLKRTTINAICKAEGITEKEAYVKYFDKIFSDTNAQTSIRTRVIDHYKELDGDEVVETRYIPRSGREKGRLVSHYYISPTIRRVIWLKDTAEKRGTFVFMREKLGTYWEGFSLNNLTKEGGVQFANGKKPEALIERIFDLATDPGDLVMDSFMGSGTTGAVAMKMKRRWIGVEMGDQAHTHCAVRFKNVIDGEQGGISKDVDWKGGGGFRFCTLGPTIFDEQGRINPEIKFPELARHLWFVETKTPMASETVGTIIGSTEKMAYALLYNGILKDRTPNGGNVLTSGTLKIIREDLEKAHPGFEGEVVVYAAASRIGPDRLRDEGIIFKQTPYDISARG